jgi:hypothetical protein
MLIMLLLSAFNSTFSLTSNTFAQISNASSTLSDTNANATNTTTLSATTIKIGNLTYQENGRVTGKRVLDVNGPVMENSYSASGTLKGNIPVTNIGTIKVFIRSGGAIYGEGQGVMLSRNGEIATWISQAIGHADQNGNVIVYDSVVFGLSSTGNTSFLNNMMLVFKQLVSQTNNVSSKAWEIR